MPLYVWISLALFLFVLVAGAVFLGRRALGAWRVFKRFQSTVLDGLGDVLRRADAVEARLTQAAGTAARLDEATWRLRNSLARAAVLSQAASEVRGSIGRARSAVPRK